MTVGPNRGTARGHRGRAGDVLWYAAQLATEAGLDLEAIAEANLEKLASRSGAPSCKLGRQPPGRLRRCAVARLGDEVGREPPHLALRQAGAHEHALPRVLALLDRRPERVQLRELSASSYGSRRRTPRSGRRSARRSGPAARRRPRPWQRRSGARRESGSRAAGDRAGRPGRSCSGRARAGRRRRRSRAAPLRPQRSSRPAGRPTPTRRGREGRGRRRASPRASRRSPRRAGSAGGG